MNRVTRPWFLLPLVLLFVFPAPAPARAGGESRWFPQTGHHVQGVFWTYWQEHGGLPQQGYPLSDAIQERSELDGHTYTVQYFERAVFELHPENRAPYNVLLAQLGTEAYRRYLDHPPVQQPDLTNSRYFPQTGHTVGGRFRAYWETHGGLAQQGYPLTAEFAEQSPVDGKTYTVQYFERAVFELHPENPAPYDVLLSQLGTQRLHATYLAPCRDCAMPLTLSPATVGPTPACDLGGTVNGRAQPAAVSAGQTLIATATGFTQAEPVVVTLTAPDGRIVATQPDILTRPGEPYGYPIVTRDTWVPGRWAVSIEGVASHHKAVIFFCVAAPAGNG